jgi:hypothetical protein
MENQVLIEYPNLPVDDLTEKQNKPHRVIGCVKSFVKKIANGDLTLLVAIPMCLIALVEFIFFMLGSDQEFFYLFFKYVDVFLFYRVKYFDGILGRFIQI